MVCINMTLILWFYLNKTSLILGALSGLAMGVCFSIIHQQGPRYGKGPRIS